MVAHLTTTLTEGVEQAVFKGLQQLHRDTQLRAQRITQTEEWISSIKDEDTAVSAEVARLTSAHRELQEKVDDLENQSRCNNLQIMGLPESYMAAMLVNPCSTTIIEQLGLRFTEF